ncbi:MAG TPA: hypothetical protein VFJ65_09600 [Solirubrobacterales bacterium]|nr:hypothetical protein [Solirubrobacterales bacterium]
MTALTILLADGTWEHRMGDWGIGWLVVMVLAMVLFWGLLIAAAVWLARSYTSGQRYSHPRDPSEVLDRRLASGEISSAEYRERRELLSK